MNPTHPVRRAGIFCALVVSSGAVIAMRPSPGPEAAEKAVAKLTTMTLDPGTIATGGTSKVTVRRDKAGSTAILTISSSNPEIATVAGNVRTAPNKLVIGSSSTSGSFTATAQTTTGGCSQLKASHSSEGSLTGWLYVAPPPTTQLSPVRLALTSNVTVKTELTTLTVHYGATITGKVTLLSPAGSRGATVYLSSSSGAVAVPASVYIPAGQSSGSFSAAQKGYEGCAVITASYSGAASRQMVIFFFSGH